MRVKYRCKVRSEVRLKYSFSLRSKHFEYEFEVDPNGQLTYVSAVAVVPDKGMWPKVRPSTVPGVSIDIEMKSPYRDLARREIRAAEGMLSLVGVHEIEFETAEESWLHDSPEEQAELQLFRASKSYGPRPVQEWPYTPFDLVARAFLAASAGMKIDTALSFFRKGRQDIVDRRYIEAIYDFLFMIETLYADGKFKSAQVEGALLRNSRLQSILEETIRDAGLHRVIARDNRILAAFRRALKRRAQLRLIPRLDALRAERRALDLVVLVQFELHRLARVVRLPAPLADRDKLQRHTLFPAQPWACSADEKAIPDSDIGGHDQPGRPI